MEKRIYFVRHGESEGNAGVMRQPLDSPLTKKGAEQAAFIAKRVARLPFDALISSTLKRAVETAHMIEEETGKTTEYSDLFVERRRPSITYGILKTDPIGLAADREVTENFDKPGYRHSDEENFDDLKARAAAALAYLLERPEQRLVVVTHGFFLRIVAAYAIFGSRLTGHECEQVIRTLRMENTGLTILDQTGQGWIMRTWNDHAHLG